MAGSWPREAETSPGPEGCKRGGSARLCPPSKRVTLGHSLCLPLVSALNGDQIWPQSAGMVSTETWTENSPSDPEGYRPRGPHTLIDTRSP